MALTIDDVVTHYILSSHPRNKAIVDIKNKKTGEIRFIKIRHRLSKFYAVSLVDPVTFEVWAETQVKSATARIKPIILHLDNKKDASVEFRDSSRIGFEWSFVWEGEKYRWVRESRMSSSLECRAIRKTGDICVAQYLPRMLKDEYFGIFSLLGYNMLRCNLTKSRELELIILMSLMTLLDKSNDGGWKRDPISTGVQEDIVDYNTSNISRAENNNNSIVLPIAYEDPIPKKSLQKKYKVELVNDQKLQLMLEKDVRRSQKQIQSDQKYHKSSLSAGNSPAQSPKASPLPTPSTSTSTHAAAPAAANDTRLKRQKSASALLSSNQDPSLSPTSSHSSNNGPGRLTRLFSSLSHMKQTGEPSTLSPVITSPAEKHNKKPMDDISSNKTNQAVSQRYNNMDQQQQINREKIQQRKQQLQQQQMEQEHQHTYPYYNHQLSLPTGGQMSRLTDEFGKMSTKYDSPPSLRSIRWNPEPPSPIVTNNYPTLPTYHAHRSNSGISRVDDQRRMSASEYPLYSYHHASNQHHQYGNYNYNNRYSTSEYYIRRYHQHDQQQQQQQQQQYDYYP